MEDEISPVESEPPSSSWNDWRWQFKNRITDVKDLKQILPEASISAGNKFQFAITPYYLSLIKEFNTNDPIYKMIIPQDEELFSGLYTDPLCEDEMSPVNGLVHRYKDRCLVISTNICAANCRYCTRKRKVGEAKKIIREDEILEIVNYLTLHPEVSDVIISGGDPLTFETSYLEKIISSIRSVPTVDIIRIGTKVPVVLPMRVNDELTEMLKKYHPIFISVHFSHPNEITNLSKMACERLANSGIPLLNQSVLLKGVNDNEFIIEELCRKLVKMRVRPYYLYQCDLVEGTEHFRTTVAKGIEIMEYLRGRLSGLAIPQFVIDSPGGKGKIPLLPQYIVNQNQDKIILRNYKMEQIEYPAF